MRDNQYDKDAIEKAAEFIHKIARKEARMGTKRYQGIYLDLYWPAYTAACKGDDEWMQFCAILEEHGPDAELPKYEPPITQNEIAWQELVAILRSGITQGIFAGVIGTAFLIVIVKKLIRQLKKN
ncbi:hypothetical protein HQ571_04300 [Candidatus Kuenenbacteria bacterium]|nr:hypothetical protein [Candidatus Kuenenbacteria bacterium]